MTYEQEEIEKAGVRATSTASYLMLSGIFTLVVYGLAFIAIARLLGPTGYGIYTIAVSISGAFGAVGNFGIATYLERQIPIVHEDKRKLEETIIYGLEIITLLALAVVLIGILLSKFLSILIFHNFGETLVIEVAVVGILFSMLYGTGHGAMIGLNDGKGSMIASVVYTISQAVFSLGLILLGYGVLGAVLGFLAGLVLGTLALLFIINKRHDIRIRFIIKGLFKRIKEVFSFSMPITGSNFISSLPSNFGVILLGIYAPAYVVGDYGVASRIASILGVLTGSFVVLLPFFSSLNQKKANLSSVFSYLLYIIFLFGLPFILYFTVFSKQITYTLFPRYTGIFTYISLISISVIISMITTVASSLVVSKAKVKKVLKFSSIVGLSELALLFLFIPYLAAYGLIIVLYFIGSIIACALYLNELKREGTEIKTGRIKRVAYANLVLLLVFLALAMTKIYSTYLLIMAFVILFILYPPMVGLFGAINAKDADRLQAIMSHIPVFGRLVNLLIIYSLKFVIK